MAVERTRETLLSTSSEGDDTILVRDPVECGSHPLRFRLTFFWRHELK